MAPTNAARDALFRRLEEAAAAREVPGCVALVWRHGGVAYHEAHGFLATHEHSPVRGAAVARDTIYDLASLTKVLCTTTLAARFVARGLVALDDPVPKALRTSAPVDAVPTLADLLEHCAGLEAHREFFVDADSREQLIEAVRSTPPSMRPRQRAVYSDLGFIILGAWLEQLGGASLESLFQRWIARPLSLDIDDALAFRPISESGLDGRELERIAPTEVYDPNLHPADAPSWLAVRRRPDAHGEVHDDNAYKMGGVAGHAGLFGHAEAVLQMARCWVEDSPLRLPASLRARFVRRSTVPGSTRRLGWDGPEADGGGSTAEALSEAAFGHLGFTGTSLWIDPNEQAGAPASIYVLLSNRVHPTRADERIRQLRRDFHRLAAQL